MAGGLELDEPAAGQVRGGRTSPTASGAITSSEHCRTRLGVRTRARSARLSDRNVARAKRDGDLGVGRGRSCWSSSSPSSGRSALPMITGAIWLDQPR